MYARILYVVLGFSWNDIKIHSIFLRRCNVVAGVPKVKHATSELVRRKTTGQPLEDEEPESKVARGRKMWKGKTEDVEE